MIILKILLTFLIMRGSWIAHLPLAAEADNYYQQHDGNAPWSTQIFKVALADGETEQLTHIGIWNSPGAWFDPAYALPVQPHVSLLTPTWAQLKTSFLKNR